MILVFMYITMYGESRKVYANPVPTIIKGMPNTEVKQLKFRMRSLSY